MTEISIESKTAEVAHRELNELIFHVPEVPDDVYEARDELEENLNHTQESLEETHSQ